MPNPTIVSASLDDKELQQSIANLVAHVKRGLHTMLTDTNSTVNAMEKKLKSLGNLKIDSGGSADGGASKRAKAQNAETDAVEKNIAARDKQIKKNQEAVTSFDNFAKAQQVAIRSANPSGMRNAEELQTMNIQLDLLRERLREARQQYSSFVALAAHATTTGDKGLFQYATDGVHRYEQEVRNLIPQIRTLQSGIQQMGDVIAPQGHTIQNYVNSLQKANPELAALNAQYKSGTSLLQDQNVSYSSATGAVSRYTEAIRKQAQAIRESRDWQEKGRVVSGDTVFYDPERANVSKRDKQLLLSLEEQIVQAQQKEAQEALVAAEAKRQQAQAAKEAAQASKGVSSYDLGIDPNVSAGRQRQIASTRAASKETEYLKQQVASLLEVEEREVKSVNMTTASYSELSQHLKQLQSAYNKLGADRIKKGEGIDIANEIQRTQRAMQKLQQTMSRPVSLKDAFGGSEKTLDDLAYKMRRLQSYRGGLNFKTQSDEVLRVNQKYAELQKKMDVIMERNQRMIASNNALGRSWNYMKNRLAFYVTVGAGTSFIKQLIDIRSQYEMNEKALGILLDSASRGTRIFNELSQMALVSPYTLIELSNAAKQLTAYDIAAKDVVDTTRRLADMASAVGVPVERLTYALGQIKAYGYLNSRDARMFANAGIPLVKQLADRYSELEGKMVSTADVYDRMKKKAIDYNDVMAVINKMTDEGGKFFDFQAKMAETLKVRLANLTLAWNNMLNDMGKDNQGWFSSGLKGLTTAFKHWRELYRIISTVIVAIGAYKTVSMVAGIAASRAVSITIPAWFRLASIVRTTQGNIALLGLTMRSIPFTAWVTAIATLASYFILFNNSSDDVKQKLEDIKSAFDGVRKEVETLFADAIKTDNIGTQLTKLRDMLELAETELGVTIPIRLEDVNESNIKQKLKEAKQFVDEYINFSQTFSEAAAGTKFNELMNDFGSKARSTYTNVTESINSVVVALQELSDKGQASKRDIEILNELTSGQKDDESRIEYLQRLISLYEELGLIGQKKVTPKVSFFGSSEDNIEELKQQQENALDRLGIKNKSVFENMLKDVQGYYSSSSIAAYQFEQQVMRVAEKIDINNIPVEQRTMKLTAAINEEASQNNWNQFEKELARQIANEKFGTTIEISDESKKAAEEDLQAWQRNIQNWAKNNGITFDVSFQTNDTEVSYAKRMLQEAKDAKELWETLSRKEKQGTGSKDATTQAYNDYIERRKLAEAAGADLSSLDPKNRNKAESELAKALKDELSTIDKIRSIYKDLTKEGMSHANAVERATRGWDETVNAINRVLQKNGLQKLDLSKFAGIENPRELVNMLQSQLNTLLKRGAKPAEIKEFQTKINTLWVDVDKYDLDMITKGLNNELGKLKDEYELAVAIDADPELGNAFADMMGINVESLPHTVKEYADEYSKYLNKYLKGKDSSLQFTGDELRGLTRDDITAFREQVDAGSFNQEWFDVIKKAYEDISGKRKKDLEETEKWKNSLIEKYGNLQDKLTKIYKDSVQNQVNAVKTFGTEGQKSDIVRLQLRLEETDNPAELAEINTEIAKIVKDVTDKNPIALKLVTASDNQTKADTSKAYWEDFKNSELYTMTFEDMANNSTRAIELIIDKLNSLKDHVKEDPASMKALIKSLEDAEKELNARDPFGGIARSLKNMEEASKETKDAQEALWRAEIDVEQAQQEYDNAEDGTPDERAEAQKKLAGAIQKRAQAEVNLTQAESKSKKAQENLKSSLQGVTNQLGDVKSLFDTVSKLFRAGGDDDTADAIDAISEGFSVMTTVIMGVVAAMVLLKHSQPWLLAIAAALSVIVGLASFLNGQKNKKIDEEIKDSELAVKRLENAYKELQAAVEEAYGTMKYGAEQAAIANKKMQLEEKKRQLQLEKSRGSKDYDKDKIETLKGEIIDLEQEIKKATKDIINDMLGITSVGDTAEQLVTSMIEAFRKGEDYMLKFDESFDNMIDNMIMKAIVGQVIGERIQEIFDKIKENANTRGGDYEEKIDNLAKEEFSLDAEIENEEQLLHKMIQLRESGLSGASWEDIESLQNNIDNLKKLREENKKEQEQAQKDYSEAIKPTPEDVDGIREDAKNMRDEVKSDFKAWMEAFGITFGEDSTKKLSTLKQGIQGITEDTAGALEGITNGISQQCYLQSDLLTQIRDAVVGIDIDVQVATQAQMLLQLQQSYAVQMAIQGILEGVLNPSGRAFSVELVS